MPFGINFEVTYRGGSMRFTSQHWTGLLIGVGLGLMLGAALVELELLTLGRKAWVAILGSLFFLVGGLLARKAPPGPA